MHKINSRILKTGFFHICHIVHIAILSMLVLLRILSAKILGCDGIYNSPLVEDSFMHLKGYETSKKFTWIVTVE